VHLITQNDGTPYLPPIWGDPQLTFSFTTDDNPANNYGAYWKCYEDSIDSRYYWWCWKCNIVLSYISCQNYHRNFRCRLSRSIYSCKCLSKQQIHCNWCVRYKVCYQHFYSLWKWGSEVCNKYCSKIIPLIVLVSVCTAVKQLVTIRTIQVTISETTTVVTRRSYCRFWRKHGLEAYGTHKQSKFYQAKL